MSLKQKRMTRTIICTLLLVYVLLHSSPTAAVRTAMFLSGNPKAAVHSEIERMRDRYDGVVPDHLRSVYGVPEQEYDNYRFPEIRYLSSGIDMSTACVRKHGFLYYAELGCF
ncbi:hypothetical protein [Bacillus rhizoplanae]|uniref:hypothetical protein n=1 Tax=Bacillus rhizoplanae TaxID=2880966 RepID=UPI003D1F77E9